MRIQEVTTLLINLRAEAHVKCLLSEESKFFIFGSVRCSQTLAFPITPILSELAAQLRTGATRLTPELRSF